MPAFDLWQGEWHIEDPTEPEWTEMDLTSDATRSASRIAGIKWNAATQSWDTDQSTVKWMMKSSQDYLNDMEYARKVRILAERASEGSQVAVGVREPVRSMSGGSSVLGIEPLGQDEEPVNSYGVSVEDYMPGYGIPGRVFDDPDDAMDYGQSNVGYPSAQELRQGTEESLEVSIMDDLLGAAGGALKGFAQGGIPGLVIGGAAGLAGAVSGVNVGGVNVGGLGVSMGGGVRQPGRTSRGGPTKATSIAENGRLLSAKEYAAKYGYYPKRKKRFGRRRKNYRGGGVSNTALIKALISKG